jgi:FkbM family methyltransferase
MGFPYAARRFVSRSSPMVRVPIKGVGLLTLRLRSSDEPTVRQVFVDRQYDMRSIPQWRDIERRYEELLEHGRRPLIIDAGANIGAASLYFAREFPKAKIIAVEPERSNVRICCENTNALDVEVLPMAIGSACGKVSLVDEECENWAFATKRSNDGDIAICTINDIVTNHQRECDLFLVKIDIEGFESDLFSANVEWVRNAKVIFIEPHDWLLPGQATSRNFQRVLAEHEFDLIVSGENLLYVRR